MDFDLSESQRLLADGVERFIGDRYPFSKRQAGLASQRGWCAETWKGLGEMGLTALPFAEADGGFDGTAVDVMLVMERFGRALLVEPYLPSVVMAGRALRVAGSRDQRARHLRRIADGSAIAAWAHAEPGGRFDRDNVRTVAIRDGTGWCLSGMKSNVLHGAAASLFIVSAREDGPSGPLRLFLVERERVTPRPSRRIDGMPTADLALDRVRVHDADRLGAEQNAAEIVDEVEDAACAAVIAEAVGAMDGALRATLAHVKTRVQFGSPIGRFQAIQHRASDMYIALELSRSMAMYAALAMGRSDPDGRRAGVSASKVVIDRCARVVGDSVIQLHGGIGMTDEHVAGHYARKLAAVRASFGDAAFHAERLVRLGSVLEDP